MRNLVAALVEVRTPPSDITGSHRLMIKILRASETSVKFYPAISQKTVISNTLAYCRPVFMRVKDNMLLRRRYLQDIPLSGITKAGLNQVKVLSLMRNTVKTVLSIPFFESLVNIRIPE